MTAAAFAPAEPSGTSFPPTRAATAAAHCGARLRLTTMRSGVSGARRAGWSPAVERTLPWAGGATGAAGSPGGGGGGLGYGDLGDQPTPRLADPTRAPLPLGAALGPQLE